MNALSQKQKALQLAELKTQITLARKTLHALWETKGRTDDEVLNASIELDQLLNQYHQLFRKE